MEGPGTSKTIEAILGLQSWLPWRQHLSKILKSHVRPTTGIIHLNPLPPCCHISPFCSKPNHPRNRTKATQPTRAARNLYGASSGVAGGASSAQMSGTGKQQKHPGETVPPGSSTQNLCQQMAMSLHAMSGLHGEKTSFSISLDGLGILMRPISVF